MNTPSKKIHLLSVNMGYGHQRTAFALKNLAKNGEIINANDYDDMPAKDRNVWESSRKFYEFISRFKRFPLLGNAAFAIFDEFQKILEFYPKRNLSKPSFTLKKTYDIIKKGWGDDLIKKLKKDSIPIISTFFIPAFMADFFNYPKNIYCVVCDADVSRSWAPINTGESRIKYFAPNKRVVERLELYGIKKENIFLTGYPLPLSNIGKNKKILKDDLKYRILNLDPKKKYIKKYKPLIEKYLGYLPEKSDHPLTVFFSVGGAGAQKEIAFNIVKGLKEKAAAGKVKIILSAGIRENVRDYFFANMEKHKLDNLLQNKTVEIIFEKNIEDYFNTFNAALRKTDILWTKPSELSFYTALGLPIIIAPTIGSQETFNRDWLLNLGSGIMQKNPLYADQWLFDLLDEGKLAEAAMQGFIKAISRGALNIEKIIAKYE
ncbi:MAG: hypothetical protein V1655_04035 [bacterium]